MLNEVFVRGGGSFGGGAKIMEWLWQVRVKTDKGAVTGMSVA